MEKKKRLGRGLDEVADLWLSSQSATPEEAIKLEQAKGEKAGFTTKTISVIYPESAKVKGLLIANIALELAKSGLGSCILDYERNGSHVKSLIGNLFQKVSSLSDTKQTPSETHQVVRLYGMPSIHVFSYPGGDFSQEYLAPYYSDSLFTQIISNNLQESIIFLCHQDALEGIISMQDIPSVIIIITRPKRESLLISYAYIKSIITKAPGTRIWMIMDEVIDSDEAQRAFTLFSETANRLLPDMKNPIKFLGSVVHDQALGISIATRFPLVLSEENSQAKDSITSITTNLVKFMENPD